MRVFARVSCLILTLSLLGGAALAEQPAAKVGSSAFAAVKAKSLNRMSVGVYQSLRVNISNRALARNASRKSAVRGDASQNLRVAPDTLTNRKIAANVTRAARKPTFATLRAASSGPSGLSPVSVPEGAKLNKLH